MERRLRLDAVVAQSAVVAVQLLAPEEEALRCERDALRVLKRLLDAPDRGARRDVERDRLAGVDLDEDRGVRIRLESTLESTAAPAKPSAPRAP